MNLRQTEIIKELRRLKSLSINNEYPFILTIKGKEYLIKKSKSSLLPVLNLHYNKNQNDKESFDLVIQFLDESMNTKIAEKRFNSLVNSTLANKLGIPDKEKGYYGQPVKINLSIDLEDISKIILELCQLFSEKEDIDIVCTYYLFLDFNNISPNDLILHNTSQEFKKLEDTIDLTIQKLLFNGFSKSIEIFQDQGKKSPVLIIIFNTDDNNENFSIYLHTPPLNNTELENVFARIKKFELMDYTSIFELYDNEIDTRLDLTYQNLSFCKLFIIKYLEVLFPGIDINTLQSDIIDFSKIE